MSAPSGKPFGHHVHGSALRSALELRYQVYCLECSFLSPADYPDGIETDEHDASAAHFYAFDSKEELVGYVRLVRPDIHQQFPIQSRCPPAAEGVELPLPTQTAEVSRLMVRNDYRRRRTDKLSGVTATQNNAIFAGERRHASPQILLSLYRQMYHYSRANGIRFWYAAMEQALARSLLRANFAFKAIGPQTDYFGPVAPYLADLQEMETQVASTRPDLLAWIQQPAQ